MNEQHKQPKSDIEIAQAARMRPITDVGRDKLGIPADALLNYGPHKAKVSLDYIRTLEDQPDVHSTLEAARVPEEQRATYLKALAGLAEAGTIERR